MQANVINKKKKKGEDDFSQYKDLIAGSDEESEYGHEDERVDQQHIEAMRRKLLEGIKDQPTRHKDLQSLDDEELEVNFGIGFGEDIGKKLLEKKKDKEERAEMSEF